MYIKNEENGTSRVAEGSVQLSGLHSLVHTMHAMILFQMSLTPRQAVSENERVNQGSQGSLASVRAKKRVGEVSRLSL